MSDTVKVKNIQQIESSPQGRPAYACAGKSSNDISTIEKGMIKKMKKILKKLLARFGYNITKLNSKVDEAFENQRRLIANNITPNSAVTIFDVGAFEGHIALKYNNLLENCRIYCFEPFFPSFEILKKNTIAFKNIHIFNSALSNITGQVDFHVNNFAQTNSLLATHPSGDKTWGQGLLDTVKKTKINSIKLDDFIIEHKIEKIDILKLDTQGTESQIIEGASKSIKENKIFLIYLEIILMPTYQQQKNFDEVLMLLRTTGFKLHNFYNYNYNSLAELRQVDAIFVKDTK